MKYIKKKNKSSSKIGPFIVNKKIIEACEAETLLSQYNSVFTVPKEDFYINDPDVFFNNCKFCEKQITHFCILDEDMSKENYYCELECKTLCDVSVQTIPLLYEDSDLEYNPVLIQESLSKVRKLKIPVIKNIFITEDMIIKSIDTSYFIEVGRVISLPILCRV